MYCLHFYKYWTKTCCTISINFIVVFTCLCCLHSCPPFIIYWFRCVSAHRILIDMFCILAWQLFKIQHQMFCSIVFSWFNYYIIILLFLIVICAMSHPADEDALVVLRCFATRVSSFSECLPVSWCSCCFHLEPSKFWSHKYIYLTQII